MPIEIEEDLSKPPGYARITLTPGLPAGQRVDGLRIGRLLAEQEYLGAAGWHGKPVVLPVQEVGRSAEQVILQVGPEIVNRIDAETRVSIEIVGPGLHEDVFWPALAMSPARDSATIVLTGKSRDKGARLTETGQQGPKPDEEEKFRIVDPPPFEPEEPVKDKRLPWLLALLLLVAATGLAGFYFLTSDPGVAPPEGMIAPSAAKSSWTDRYNLLRDADQGGAELLDLHNEIVTDPSPDFDTAYRALELAAKRGNGQAAFQLASLYDPASFDERYFSRPNPLKAHEWYEASRSAEVEAAGPAIESLCAASQNPPGDQAEMYVPLAASGKCN